MEKSQLQRFSNVYGIVISIFELNNIDQISSAVPYHSIVETSSCVLLVPKDHASTELV